MILFSAKTEAPAVATAPAFSSDEDAVLTHYVTGGMITAAIPRHVPALKGKSIDDIAARIRELGLQRPTLKASANPVQPGVS